MKTEYKGALTMLTMFVCFIPVGLFLWYIFIRIAFIRYGKKKKNLGRYDTAEEAAEAYKKAAQEKHGEYARC